MAPPIEYLTFECVLIKLIKQSSQEKDLEPILRTVSQTNQAIKLWKRSWTFSSNDVQTNQAIKPGKRSWTHSSNGVSLSIVFWSIFQCFYQPNTLIWCGKMLILFNFSSDVYSQVVIEWFRVEIMVGSLNGKMRWNFLRRRVVWYAECARHWCRNKSAHGKSASFEFFDGLTSLSKEFASRNMNSEPSEDHARDGSVLSHRIPGADGDAHTSRTYRHPTYHGVLFLSAQRDSKINLITTGRKFAANAPGLFREMRRNFPFSIFYWRRCVVLRCVTRADLFMLSPQRRSKTKKVSAVSAGVHAMTSQGGSLVSIPVGGGDGLPLFLE